jgi:hypothetical protein
MASRSRRLASRLPTKKFHGTKIFRGMKGPATSNRVAGVVVAGIGVHASTLRRRCLTEAPRLRRRRTLNSRNRKRYQAPRPNNRRQPNLRQPNPRQTRRANGAAVAVGRVLKVPV